MRFDFAQPTVEPLTLTDDLVMANCRLDSDDESALFSLWIKAAREYCESRISQFFITRTGTVYLDAWPHHHHNYWPLMYSGNYGSYYTGSTHYTHRHQKHHNVIEIPYCPLQSITSIEYVPSGGTDYVTWATDQYYVSTGRKPRIQALGNEGCNGFPELAKRIDSVKITMQLGYGDASTDVPADALHAMLLYVGEANKQRALSTDLPLKVVPLGIDDLLARISTGGEFRI